MYARYTLHIHSLPARSAHLAVLLCLTAAAAGGVVKKVETCDQAARLRVVPRSSPSCPTVGWGGAVR